MWSQKAYRRYLRSKNLREAIRNQKRRAWLNKKIERQVQIIVIMFFVGLLLTGIYGTTTIATWNYVIRIYLTFALIFSFLPQRIFPLIYKIQPELKLLFAICGLSPFLLGFVLTLNYHVSDYTRTDAYNISDYKVYYIDKLITVELENEALKKHRELRKFSSDTYHFIPDSAAYEISTGIFGLEVVKKSYLIKK